MSQCKMQKYLDKIIKWCNTWKIKFNPLKNKFLHFSKRKHNSWLCNIKMDNVKLNAEKSVKFLGVMFGNKLTFEERIRDKVINTRHNTSNCYSLRSKKYRIPDKTITNLSKIFIRPNFHYGNRSLITAENKYIYKWEKIQINAL